MEKASQDKREKNTSYQPEMHVRNANSREIFKNDMLTSQFLRNYTNIPLLSNVMPEDIEDVSQKYQAFLGVEFEADTIKKVYIRRMDGTIEREVYVLSLIEHKSDIDYDVAMQLLRYMCVIWQEYKATQNKIQEGSSRRKNFRYPLIIPIVYYEGEKEWTAGLHLKDRIDFSEEMAEYIPDFTYQVVSLNKYTNEELSKKHDEMSLVMLTNKIQSSEDIEGFRNVTEAMVNSPYVDASDEKKEVYKKILWYLLMKMKVLSENSRKMRGGTGENARGYLFENMEEIDIGALKRNTAREKQRAEEEKQRADALEEEVKRLRKLLEIQEQK
ncbi:Rpn family recombination-promoting nuclease/putative transposase [Blautia sp. MSJ-19]|uniref:Rpn family recombination-promoting nuclease/putative transposase n=1 Tax=Blautia sp. MSJ-19 TaxID=2841517 RepID=UPI001C0EED91|nr:Rpn family recombination-promoting nuclease/putative transposase [Blautia sp. MSJ-19]MBU5481979.1 Rpn family recombination-promoting nuclease/putative transposase [Blautia sp. MSJ-19]